MKSNRIILFIDSLGTGGAQRQIVNLAIGLKNKGLDPLLVSYSYQNYFQEVLKRSSIESVCVKRKSSFDLLFTFRLYKLIRKEKAHWLISFLFMPSGYALLLKLLMPKLEVIVSERSFEQKTKLREKIFPRFLYGKATYITANSITQANVLLNNFPKYSSQIKFIPNGVLEQRLIYKYDKPDLTIVSIGRVSKLKETKLLINALAKFRDRFGKLGLRVRWIGAKYDVNPADTVYYEECVALIEMHKMQLIWEWTGQISDVPSILSEASLVVHMSAGEGFPNAICEAMSLGIPVIASKVMDHPNIIVNEYNGYLVASGDLNGLEKALNSFFNLNTEARREMSEHAFNTAVQSFSLEKMIDSYYNLLISHN